MAESVAKHRARRLIQQNRSASGDGLPIITYGKQTKPLPLKGTHFLPRDVYDIPPDEEPSSPPRTSKPPPAIRRPPRRRRDPDPDDSPLSEDELEAVFGPGASPLRSPQSSPVLVTPSSKTSLNQDRQHGFLASSHPLHGKGIAKTISKAAIKPGWQYETGIPKSSPQQKAPSRRSKTVAKTPAPKPSAPPPARRLPVNELLFSAASEDVFRAEVSAEPRETFPSAESQDPIAESFQRPAKKKIKQADQGPYAARLPLTSIRKRLKTPMWTHRSVIELRKKQRGKTPLKTIGDNIRNLGDGFERDELKINHNRLAFRSDRKKKNRALVLGFGALRLQSGQLPDVEFDSSVMLKTEAANTNHDDGYVPQNNSSEPPPISVPESKALSEQKDHRRVSFSSRVMSDEARAQLSSVSAPRRAYTISSDGSSEEEDFVMTDDETEASEGGNDPRVHDDSVDGDEDAEKSSEESDRASPARTPPSNQRARRNSRFWTHGHNTPPAKQPVNSGISLDFRRTAAPGIAPPRTPFGKRRLMEVNETIMDEPPLPSDANAIYNQDSDQQFPSEPPPRPRSILRRNIPAHLSGDTRPETTEANTRRNSSMVDLFEESRYFASATEMLKQPQERPKRRVIKQRSSTARSEYLAAQTEIYVPDSESVVPETCPERSNFVDDRHLNVLKRNSEAMWTSGHVLPREREVQDLRSLTRNVSRQNGTMNQALGRRRPSLPFQSPTKVRR